VPRNIDDDELLIRAVTTYNKKSNSRLRGSLFKNADDEVSVSRRRWVEPWLAKLIAKGRLQNFRCKPPNRYEGLAFISARTVRAHGSSVEDSRSEYIGHAHISHGIIRQPVGEALPVALKRQNDDRAQAIADSARFLVDPNPRGFRWSGDCP
jgi:hypothetical protein